MYIDFYFRNYKKLMFIPLILLALSFIVIGLKYAEVGDIVEKDISLKGGVVLSVYVDANTDNLESMLSKKYNNDIIVRKLTEFGSSDQNGFIIEASAKGENDQEFSQNLINDVESELGIRLTGDNYSIEQTGSSLGRAFYRQMAIAMIAAFILMGIVIMLTFRNWIASFAVVFSAFSDIVITIALINVLSIKLSTSGIAALLLLIGYSVDTDVLLTTRVIKRKEGNVRENVLSSMKTGLTMTITTLVALTVGYFVSDSLVIKNMFLIIILGLMTDIIVTYLFNAGILINYVKKINKHDS